MHPAINSYQKSNICLNSMTLHCLSILFLSLIGDTENLSVLRDAERILEISANLSEIQKTSAQSGLMILLCNVLKYPSLDPGTYQGLN